MVWSKGGSGRLPCWLRPGSPHGTHAACSADLQGCFNACRFALRS